MNMRTRPLPNRHAHSYADHTECVQKTLNKHRNKPDLDLYGFLSLLLLLFEEILELVWEVCYQSLRRALRLAHDFPKVEREAQDVAVIVFALWLRARNSARTKKESKG